MVVWPISNHLALDGSGGLRASGRWHSRGRRIVYCALNPATALLEALASASSKAGTIRWTVVCSNLLAPPYMR